MTNVRGLIAVAVKRGCDIFQLDINNAFLHGDLNEEVFIEVPPRLMVPGPGLVCRLNKSLYGLKQAMYVDDMILIGTDLDEIKLLNKFLHDSFKINDLGSVQYFLGLKTLFKDDGVIIIPRKFVIGLLKEYNCLSCSPLSSPLDPNVKLEAKEGTPLLDPSCYRKLIGKLNFLTNTRLDITFSVQHLSQFVQDPREPHLKASYHLLRHLKADPGLRVFFSKNVYYTVRACCDFDWASCPDSRKSVNRYIVLLGDSPISWKSKKHETIYLSLAEAEYRSIRKVVGELVWLQRLLEVLTVPFPSPIVVFCDNQSALHIARNPVFYEPTKHIEVDCHFVRNKLREWLISLHHIRKDHQLSDILTKASTWIKHSNILSKLEVTTSLPT
ncbi:PREDICTED: uncharacterized protein LOC109232511 [Nicotiana attenuata]|uniref:uncharacterized protein LOC109232511 n=1 Tax=Nicotiana attenuata TaxID=49451 RepID=UPI0009054F50|nr:PREDICTED: uncharacterized protein LOC109232511 [Nicotiana attenuata]